MQDIRHGSDVKFRSARPNDENKEDEGHSTEFYDATNLSEAVALVRIGFISVAESVEVSETVARSFEYHNAAESTGCTDSNAGFVPFNSEEFTANTAAGGIKIGCGICGFGEGGFGGQTNVTG